MCAALGHYDALDDCTARRTGLAMFAIDAVEKLKASAFALGVHVVRDRRSTMGNGLVQQFDNGGVKARGAGP